MTGQLRDLAADPDSMEQLNFALQVHAALEAQLENLKKLNDRAARVASQPGQALSAAQIDEISFTLSEAMKDIKARQTSLAGICPAHPPQKVSQKVVAFQNRRKRNHSQRVCRYVSAQALPCPAHFTGARECVALLASGLERGRDQTVALVKHTNGDVCTSPSSARKPHTNPSPHKSSKRQRLQSKHRVPRKTNSGSAGLDGGRKLGVVSHTPHRRGVGAGNKENTSYVCVDAQDVVYIDVPCPMKHGVATEHAFDVDSDEEALRERAVCVRKPSPLDPAGGFTGND